jgi:hypothetical protein
VGGTFPRASSCCRFLRRIVHPHVRAGHAPSYKGALKLGATMEEIMEVLKLCVAAGPRRAN